MLRIFPYEVLYFVFNELHCTLRTLIRNVDIRTYPYTVSILLRAFFSFVVSLLVLMYFGIPRKGTYTAYILCWCTVCSIVIYKQIHYMKRTT
jgi:hypothetical protein